MARLQLLVPTVLSTVLLLACSSDSGSDSSGDNGASDATTTSDQNRRRGDDADDTTASCTEDDDCEGNDICDPGLERCVPACTEDTDCARSEACNSASGQCESRAACNAELPCGEGESCDSCVGVCVRSDGPFCVEDQNCPSFDQFCDQCSQQCLPRLGICEPCIDNYQCGEAADRCLVYSDGATFCGRACGAGFACPTGSTCSEEHGQCIPLSGDCLSEDACSEDDECSGIQVCSAHGVCVDGCSSDDVCPSPTVCSAGRCEDPCLGPEDCDGENECVEGHCRRPGGCNTSRDCPEAETHCDRALGLCVDGCEVDGDCLTYTQMCVEEACVHRPCRGAYACGFGQICDDASGHCTESTDPHCAECNGDDPDSCGANNLCAAFQDEDGNDLGAFCLLACSDDPLNPCPNGWQCTEVETQDGVMNLCHRACYDSPI